MGSRTVICAAVLAGLSCSAGTRLPASARGEPVLEIGGEVKGGPYRLGEADLAALPQRRLRGVEPTAGREAAYEGVDLAAVAEGLALEKGADTLVARSADGRAVAVPLSVVRQLRPVLALRADGVPLAGRTLAWPNVEHFGVGTDPRAGEWWAARVARLEFVSWAEVYGPALEVPPGAPAGALAGARTYGARCISCHGLRGAGGSVGPDLSRGGAWTAEERLRGVLARHQGRSGPGPAWIDEARASELAAFLWTVAERPR